MVPPLHPTADEETAAVAFNLALQSEQRDLLPPSVVAAAAFERNHLFPAAGLLPEVSLRHRLLRQHSIPDVAVSADGLLAGTLAAGAGTLTNPLSSALTAATQASLLRRTAAAAAAARVVDPLISSRLSLATVVALEQQQQQQQQQQQAPPTRQTFPSLRLGRHEALLADEAYQRGREEAILSLVRSGSIDPEALRGSALAVAAHASHLSEANGIESTSTASSSSSSSGRRQDRNTQALEALGTSSIERRKTNAPYFDASQLKDPDPVTVANRRTRGGVTEPFPEKLHRMLAEVEERGESDVVSFLPHGRAFVIHHVERFCREIMPRYFKQSRLSSFQRQLNLYGFTRITSGSDAGGYYHELFLQGRPALAIHMRRVGVPQSAKRMNHHSRGSNAVLAGEMSSANSTAPDFYSMEPVKASTTNNNNNGNRRRSSEEGEKPDSKPSAR